VGGKLNWSWSKLVGIAIVSHLVTTNLSAGLEFRGMTDIGLYSDMT